MNTIMNDQFVLNEVKELFKRLKEHNMAFIFLQPIEEVMMSVPEYGQVIKNPIDMNKIEKKLEENRYQYLEDFFSDMELMLTNCKAFNNNKKHWVYKTCVAFEDFFVGNWKKLNQKIQKHKERSIQLTQHKTHRKEESVTSIGHIDTNQNIQIISNTEDEKIARRIKSLFQKLGNNLNVSEQQKDEIIALIVKSILKRSKSFDQIYDDTMKFLTKNLKNDGSKSIFSKKFRKLLRSIKEEQNESALKAEAKNFNIKINLNENDEKKEEKDKFEIIRKEVKNFIENQKVPEIYREIAEYPIEPNLRKKITSYVSDIKNSFITQH